MHWPCAVTFCLDNVPRHNFLGSVSRQCALTKCASAICLDNAMSTSSSSSSIKVINQSSQPPPPHHAVNVKECAIKNSLSRPPPSFPKVKGININQSINQPINISFRKVTARPWKTITTSQPGIFHQSKYSFRQKLTHRKPRGTKNRSHRHSSTRPLPFG